MNVTAVHHASLVPCLAHDSSSSISVGNCQGQAGQDGSKTIMFKITQLDECFLAGHVQPKSTSSGNACSGGFFLLLFFLVQGFVGFRLTFQLQPFCQAKNNNKPRSYGKWTHAIN
jgi:hypothetical protein